MVMRQEKNKYSFFRGGAPQKNTEASQKKISREIFFGEAFP